MEEYWNESKRNEMQHLVGLILWAEHCEWAANEYLQLYTGG